MICSAHLDDHANDPEINLAVIPAAVTVIHGRALCLACFWVYVNKNRPVEGEMPKGEMT